MGTGDPEGYPCQWVKPCEDSRGRPEGGRPEGLWPLPQCKRGTLQRLFETLWNGLLLVEKDQLQSVSDAGLWTESVRENRNGSVWIEERFTGS